MPLRRFVWILRYLPVCPRCCRALFIFIMRFFLNKKPHKNIIRDTDNGSTDRHTAFQSRNISTPAHTFIKYLLVQHYFIKNINVEILTEKKHSAYLPFSVIFLFSIKSVDVGYCCVWLQSMITFYDCIFL